MNAVRLATRRGGGRVFGLAVLCLAGWLVPAGAQSNRTPIVVRGDHNYPPYEFLDNGQPAGFNVELIRAVCRVMDIPVRIELGPWREVREQLETGRIDVLGGMVYSEEREALVDFSTPHSYLAFDLFARNGSSLRRLDETQDRTIVVQEGGRMHDLLRSMKGGPRVATLRDVPQIIQSLASGRYDGALLNKAQALWVMNRLHITNLKPMNAGLEPVPYCFAVAQDRGDLVLRLNEGLNIIKATGEYRDIYDKWIGAFEQEQSRRALRYILVAVGLLLGLLGVMVAWSWSLRTEVRRRTAELRQVIDLVPHMIFARDTEGRYLLVNSTFADRYGKSAEQIVGLRHLDLDHNQIQQALRQQRADEEVFQQGKPTFTDEELFTDHRGEKHILQTTRMPFRSTLSKLPAVLGISVDITSIKAAQEAVRDSESNLAITLDSIGEAVLVTNAEDCIVRLNPAASILTGWRTGEAQGRPLSEVLNLFDPDTQAPVPDPGHRILKGELLSGVAHTAMLRARRGAERMVTVTGSPIRHGDQPAQGVVVVCRDITEERRVQERLREAAKMESVGQLAGGIAHDFNNILSGIMGYAELITHSGPTDEESRQHARHILSASERARDMIQKLLAYSRRSPRRVLSVNLHQIIKEVSGLLEHTLDKRIELKLQLEAHHPMAQGDPAQLQSALMNLAVNARDAMPQGGTLTLATYDTVLKEDFCHAQGGRVAPGPFLALAVMDTGTGIKREVMEHLFEPFFTTKQVGAGTGLGLAAVRGTVDEHGGLVTVESVPGQGSTFRLYLPREEAQKSVMPDNPPREAPRGCGTVLLVDDEDIILRTTGRMLGDLGYEVLTASDGVKAVDLFRERCSTIDLVLLDVVMPGLDGLQTLAALQKIAPGVKVILSSGYMRGHEEDNPLAQGVADFLPKPYRKSQLAEMVARVLAGQPS